MRYSSRANSSAGRHWVVPWMRSPARVRHHSVAWRWAWSRSTKRSPAKSSCGRARPARRGLVRGGPHPGRVGHEPPGLGVLDEGLVQPGAEGIGRIDDGRHVVGDDHGEDATEERPRRLAPVDHRRGGLGEAQPHQAVAAVGGGEDQRPHHPPLAGLGIGDEAHPPEVDLQLRARLAVGHPHGGGAHRAAHAQDLQGVTVQGALGTTAPARVSRSWVFTTVSPSLTNHVSSCS